MFNKKHSSETKKLMATKKNKYLFHTNGVGIYDLEDNLIKTFDNNVELANYLNISKVTVGKYLNNKLVYDNKYKFKPNNFE